MGFKQYVETPDSHISQFNVHLLFTEPLSDLTSNINWSAVSPYRTK